MKRVLFVTQTYNVWGGMEQWLDGLVAWLQQRGEWNVRVGVARGLRFNDHARYLAAHPHMKPEVLDVRTGTESVRQSAIVAAIERFRPDLVIPLLSGSAFPAVATAKRRGIETRLLVPIYLMSQPGLFVNVADYLPIVDGVVVWNRLFHDYWLERVPADGERFHYIRNGVQPPEIAFRPRRHERLQCAFVGRVEQPQKRVLDLVPFVEALARLGAPVDVHVYGDGPERAALEQTSFAMPVQFHGYRTRPQLYREVWPSLDVTILFSQSEGATPFSVCEAMAHGVVPVTSRFPGLAAEGVVRDGETGLTFPIGDVDEAARQVDRLARDPALLERLARNAAAAMEGWTDERMNVEFGEAMEKTLALPIRRGAVREAAQPAAGRLDGLLTPRYADRVRHLLRRFHRHDGARGEWPAEAPFDSGEAEQVVRELLRMDAEDSAGLGKNKKGAV